MVNIVKIDEKSGIPLLGCIAFGVIDRGSNLLQIRATTVCNMKCKFCSTSANNFDMHPSNFIVDKDYLVKWTKHVIDLKDCKEIEINIDSMGEPTSYPQLAELISDLKKIPEVTFISMQTNGTLLTKELIKKLEKAGLGRINLSIHSLQNLQSKELFGSSGYQLPKILESIKEILKTKIELLLAPVWLPNVNDNEIEKIIQLSKELNCKIGIQKYEIYKYSRKMKESKHVNFYKFYKKLEEWESKYNVKLKLGPNDFKIIRTKKIPLAFKVGEKVRCVIKSPGWINNQMIGVAKNVCISINNCKLPINSETNVKIVENKNSIYIANPA